MKRIVFEQETAEDGMAGLQSKFQNLNEKVNQMLTDEQTDGQTDGHHQSISRNCFAIRPIKGPIYYINHIYSFKYISVWYAYSRYVSF